MLLLILNSKAPSKSVTVPKLALCITPFSPVLLDTEVFSTKTVTHGIGSPSAASSTFPLIVLSCAYPERARRKLSM